MAKIDWAFTEDGDLGLSDPQVDEEGQILYKHMDGSIDIDRREDGKQIRDIGWVYDLEAEKQIIMNRIRTDSPDWYHHPGMGGNLTDLIGEPNTRETGELGAAYIQRALTHAGLYHPGQISIRAVPLSADELIFMIEISKFQNEVTRLPLVFNLQHGMMNFYETPKTPEQGV